MQRERRAPGGGSKSKGRSKSKNKGGGGGGGSLGGMLPTASLPPPPALQPTLGQMPMQGGMGMEALSHSLLMQVRGWGFVVMWAGSEGGVIVLYRDRVGWAWRLSLIH